MEIINNVNKTLKDDMLVELDFKLRAIEVAFTVKARNIELALLFVSLFGNERRRSENKPQFGNIRQLLTNAYKENSPEFIYFVTLYNIFNEFLEDISEDVLPNEATGFKG